MKRGLGIASVVLILLALATAAGLWLLQRNGDVLWNIISRQCVPNQKNHHSPAPCLKVDLEQGYVVLKDINGPLHTLLLPVAKISGIESPRLTEAGAADYFRNAWDNRGYLLRAAGKPVKESYLSLAINSRYGRTQNQLHIHLACLKPEVYQLINRYAGDIGAGWQPLGAKIHGHRYLAIKVPESATPLACWRITRNPGESPWPITAWPECRPNAERCCCWRTLCGWPI